MLGVLGLLGLGFKIVIDRGCSAAPGAELRDVCMNHRRGGRRGDLECERGGEMRWGGVYRSRIEGCGALGIWDRRFMKGIVGLGRQTSRIRRRH